MLRKSLWWVPILLDVLFIPLTYFTHSTQQVSNRMLLLINESELCSGKLAFFLFSWDFHCNCIDTNWVLHKLHFNAKYLRHFNPGIGEMYDGRIFCLVELN